MTVRRIVILGAITLVVLFAVVLVPILKSGHSIDQMDWNSDGDTSMSEILLAPDIGRRAVIKDGKQCTEYFRKKDAITVKVECQ